MEREERGGNRIELLPGTTIHDYTIKYDNEYVAIRKFLPGEEEMTMSNEVFDEVQPNGERVEQTLAVVSHILTDADYAAEVASHNGWRTDLNQDKVAVLFLSSRFQWAVDLLSRQTATLKAEVDRLSQLVAGE